MTVLAEMDQALVGYGRALVAGPLSLRCALGEAVAVNGPPGSGRSTVLQALVGRADILGGRRRLFGDIVGANAWSAAPWSRRLGCVWNSRDAPLGLSVSEVLRMTGALDKAGDFLDPDVGRWVARTMLPQRMRSACATLSGGERTIVAACCALARSAEGLLIFDDVTASLQPSIADELVDILAAKVRKSALGMIFTEESESVRAKLATKQVDLTLVAAEAVLVPNQ